MKKKKRREGKGYLNVRGLGEMGERRAGMQGLIEKNRLGGRSEEGSRRAVYDDKDEKEGSGVTMHGKPNKKIKS